MALTKTPTTLFDNITISGNTYTSTSASIDLTDAVDLCIGYTLTFDAGADVGATIYLFADPSFSNSSFVVGSYDYPVDSWPVNGSSKAGHTISGNARMDHSAKFVKVRLYNHDNVSITNCSVWIAPQR